MAPGIVKKFGSYPDSSSEPIQASAVIVIHPGSLFLRIGRASDTYPYSFPHVIARRAKHGSYKDLLLVPVVKMNADTISSMTETQTVITKVLASCLTSEGRVRYSISSAKIREANSEVKPEILPGSSNFHWTRIDPSQEYVIGEDALYLNPSENFHIHWPIRRGWLNTHSSIGGSLTSVLSDLETIWSGAIQQCLDIPLKDLKHYRAVLVIPDVYCRQHVKEIVNMLLTKLKFGSCFVHLESVCATFGAGLSYACVVDVGDQKTSVSCVEDGISHRNTRLCMEYGGSDITQLFHWLFRKCGFPYKECYPLRTTDALLLQELKENMCHVNLDICGAQERSFQVKCANSPVQQYTVKIGDECMVAPLGLFHPELFELTGNKRTRTLQRSEGDPEDPNDETYLLQTQRRGNREVVDGSQSSELSSQIEDCQLSQSVLDDDVEQPDTSSSKDVEQELPCDQLLGIDQAIIQSIERCDSEEMKRKVYGCILLVGGGMLFSGIHTWLQNRLSVQIPIMFRGEEIDIITRPKDMDPCATIWKGAAVMSCLDTAQELWINQQEWLNYGVRLLRERAPFTW